MKHTNTPLGTYAQQMYLHAESVGQFILELFSNASLIS